VLKIEPVGGPVHPDTPSAARANRQGGGSSSLFISFLIAESFALDRVNSKAAGANSLPNWSHIRRVLQNYSGRHHGTALASGAHELRQERHPRLIYDVSIIGSAIRALLEEAGL